MAGASFVALVAGKLAPVNRLLRWLRPGRPVKPSKRLQPQQAAGLAAERRQADSRRVRARKHWLTRDVCVCPFALRQCTNRAEAAL